MNDALIKSGQTTGRMATLGAISVLITYLLSIVTPDLPKEVVAAIIFLVGVGLDKYAYQTGSKFKIPF